jgi:fibronectin-binding autotransporter adhesin
VNTRLHRFIFCFIIVLALLNGLMPMPARAVTSTFNFQNLTLGPSGALVGNLGDVFNIHGNLTSNSTQNVVWDTHLSQIGFNAAGPHQLTWTGTEQGRSNAGFINNFAVGNFVLPAGASLTTVGGGALYTRVLSLGGGIPQIASISGPLNIHYNPGSPQNAYLNFQTYSLPNGYSISPAAAPADVNAIWNGTTGNWTDGTKWSGGTSPLNPSTSVTLYDATINSGTATLNQSIGYIQKLNLGSGGTLTGAAGVTPWDTFTWGTVGNNAVSTVSGGAVVNANGDMNIVGDSARNLDNATINNHAGYIATWAAGNSDINFSNNAAFNNNGSFIVQNNRSLGHNGGTGTFTNSGTFTKNTGAGTTNIGSANFVFNNPGAINVQTGTLEFDGPLQGPASGAISISSGATLVIADGASSFAGSIASAGPLNIGDATGAASSASLQLLANNQITNTSVLTVKSDGLLNINGFQANVGALSVISGNVSIGSGTMTATSLSMSGGTISSAANGKMQLLGNATAGTDAGNLPATITAQVDLGGGVRTFTVTHAVAATDMIISGNISNGGLTKTGLGVMTLSGNNTYAGGSTLTQGTLNINSPTAIGAGSFTVNGVSTIDNTSSAAITLTTNNSQVWASSFTFKGTQNLNFGTGLVTLNTNPTVTVTANNLTVGVIGNGTGNSLTKAGAGTMTLFGGAAYTGTTSVNAGTLVVSSGPFASSASNVVAAATLNFVSGANAGSGIFTNNASPLGTTVQGLIQFFDLNTTAGSGIYTNIGGLGLTVSSNTGGSGAQMTFNSGTTAGSATITNQGATLRGALSGGLTLFNAGSTAGNATIAAAGGSDGRAGGPAPGGLTLFTADSNAGNSTLTSTGGSLGGVSGETEFKDNSRAGTATITITNGISGNNGTFTEFFDHSTADSAHITANSGTNLLFHNNSTGGSATLIDTGGVSFQPGSDLEFLDTATAGSANISVASNTGVGGSLKFRNNADAGHAHVTTGATNGASNATGTTEFFDTTSAASGVFTTVGQDQGAVTSRPTVLFHNSSTAGSASITNLGAGAAGGSNGAELDFMDTSNAGNTAIPATITNNGSFSAGGNGAMTVFSNSAKAGTANIINNPATIAGTGNIGGGYTYFNSGTSADHATITSNGGAFTSGSGTASGHTVFNAGSTAAQGTFYTYGATAAAGNAGEIDILDGATAGNVLGNAMFTNYGGTASGAAGGFVDFHRGGASAAGATFVNFGADVSGAAGGNTIFSDNTTAANAMVTANGGTVAGAGGSTIGLFGNPDPSHSTLIANGGTNGGNGGLILLIDSPGSGEFFPDSMVRIIANAGGTFDSSGSSHPLTVGSIEGAGTFQVGGGTLIAGALNTDTTVSGIITNGGSQGGSNAKFTKTGTGKLTLTGPSTYTGATTVNAGILSTNLLTNGGVAGGIGASSNAAANLVLNGGTFQYTGPTVSTDRAFTLGAAAVSLDASGTGPVNFTNANPVVMSGTGPRTLTLTGSNTGNNVLTGAIADGAGGATSLTKTSSGVWLLNTTNTYTGLTTISSGTLRYGGSDAPIQTNVQAYILSPANPAGDQLNGPFSIGQDFDVASGRSILVTQLGLYAASNNTISKGFTAPHNVEIYNRDTQTIVAGTQLAFGAGLPGTLTTDGYRILSLGVPVTLSPGHYSIVEDGLGNANDQNYNTLNPAVSAGTTNSGGSSIAFVDTGRYTTVVGNYPNLLDVGTPHHFGVGNFVFNTVPQGRIPGDVTINGPTAILDLGNNQNGNVATVTLDGGGAITGTGGSTLTSRTSFQLKSGSASAILTGAGIPLVKSTTGTVTLTAANTYTGSTTISAGTLVLGNSLTQSSSVSIAAGAKVSMSLNGSHVLSTPSLSIDPAGVLDLGDNDLIVSYSGASPLPTIRGLLISGFDSGNWDGNGINSLAAHSGSFGTITALGYAERSDVAYNILDGVTLAPSAVIVKYTYYGDSNLDGVVNAADFTRFLDGLATGGSTWSQGDYTYDGKVDLGNDFDLFLASYLTQGGALGSLAEPILQSDLSAAQKNELLSVVPEPSGLSLLLLSAALLRKRR